MMDKFLALLSPVRIVCAIAVIIILLMASDSFAAEPAPTCADLRENNPTAFDAAINEAFATDERFIALNQVLAVLPDDANIMLAYHFHETCTYSTGTVNDVLNEWADDVEEALGLVPAGVAEPNQSI